MRKRVPMPEHYSTCVSLEWMKHQAEKKRKRERKRETERGRETKRKQKRETRESLRERERQRETERKRSRLLKIKNIEKQNLLYGCFKNNPHKR